MVCQYTFTDETGSKRTIVGRPALKVYLASGGLSHILPARAAQVPAFKRSPVQAAASPDVQAAIQRVEQVVANQTERWASKVRVIVVADMNDKRISANVREEDARQRARNPDVGELRGFYDEGKDQIVLVAPQLTTDLLAAQVLFHEGLGHHGLRGVFGEGLNAVLEQIVALRKKDVLAKAKAYGLDPENKEDMLHAAEEVLATMAETTPQIGFVKRAIAAIKTWLRQNIKGFADMELSDAEIIRNYILPARAFVEQGGEAGRAMSNGARFSRTDTSAFKKWFGDSKVVDAEGKPLVVYHGSPDVRGIFSGGFKKSPSRGDVFRIR